MTDFLSFSRAYGLDISDLYASEKIRRCKTVDHPSSRNGAYFYDGDRGWVQNWAEGGDIEWWDNSAKQAPTQADRDEWARKKDIRQKEQLRMWGYAAGEAQALLDSATVTEHNYMHRKGLGDIKVHVLPKGKMFIPMRGMVSGQLVGGQTIEWMPDEMVFEKKYIFGSRPAGAALRLGPAAATEIVLCEGFATGHSIYKALISMRLRATVLVCFNDSNLINIAKLCTGRTYVFADNDKSMAGESAAQATGLRYCMSPVVGEDANDLMVRAGVVPVSNLIMQARKLKDSI